MTNDVSALAAGWLAALVGRLVRELEAEGIADPLAESFTLAAVLDDLSRLMEVPAPASVSALIGTVV